MSRAVMISVSNSLARPARHPSLRHIPNSHESTQTNNSNAMTADLMINLSVSHSGQTHPFAFPPDTPLGRIQSALSDTFHVPPSAQKLLTKGRKLDSSDPCTPLSALLGPSSPSAGATKVLLVGPASDALAALQADEDLRRKKHAAYERHASGPRQGVRRTGVGRVDETEGYRFLAVEPFAEEVPSYEARRKMLERLAGDEAIKDVMKRHKYVVGKL